MLRLACALGALQTVADAFPAPLPLGPRVRRAETWPGVRIQFENEIEN